MASDRIRKEIAIIGADSTHVSAFTRLINKENIQDEYQVKTVYIDRKSKLDMSVNRIETVINVLKTLDVTLVEGTDNIVSHDAFMILNVDANDHLDAIEKIKHFNKPIFVDKPLVYDKEELKTIAHLIEDEKIQLFSASALRFTPFIKRLSEKVDENTEAIIIKAPFYLEEEIPAFHWYGIHALSMLQGLCQDKIEIGSLKRVDDCYHLKGTVGSIPYMLELFTKDVHDFSAIIKTSTETYEDALVNDHEPLYSYLLKEVLAFFENGVAPISFEETEALLMLCDRLNHMI